MCSLNIIYIYNYYKMDHRNFLRYQYENRLNATDTRIYPPELRVLQDSYFPNEKANITNNYLSIFFRITDNVLYVKINNRDIITIRENLKDHVYYLTSRLIEKAVLRYDFDGKNILKKSNIEEY